VFPQKEFGYSRKDVLLIGVGVTLLGYGLKSGLEVWELFFSLCHRQLLGSPRHRRRT
jgi:hypothetical protein